jgi:2'-5' RNA ligase
MRLFVGIPLPASAVSELESLVDRLKRGTGSRGVTGEKSGLRWMPPESWHITLQFLGSTSEDRYGCLTARLTEVRSAPVAVRLEEVGAFERAGVLFLGVAATPELVALAQRVAEATSRCGFPAEERPYHPHITLARAKGQSRGSSFQAIAQRAQKTSLSRFMAGEFLLYESHTEREGAKYVVRERYKLAGD